MKIDLITGFLGAGKTTFLLRYAEYLMAQGLRIGILVYDHGEMNVDLPLLNGLRGEQCELETLAGSCDADCHRRRFRTKLIAMAMSGYDRVIIEPSGVFDMDEFFDSLQEPPLDSQYEIGSVIAIVDAGTEDSASEEDREDLKDRIYMGTATQEDIARVTERLGDEIGKVYGWDFPKERVTVKENER